MVTGLPSNKPQSNNKQIKQKQIKENIIVWFVYTVTEFPFQIEGWCTIGQDKLDKLQ